MLVHAFRIGVACYLLAATYPTFSQEFPTKPVHLVTAAAGGGADFFARLIALGMSPRLGQSVIVENRGGSSIIPTVAVSKSMPDGHMIMLYGNGVWMTPLLQKNVPYHPLKDLTAITLAVSSPNILVIHPSVPASTVKELIGYAKANPGKLNFGSSSAGAGNRLAAELFKSMAGVDIVHVPYKGAGPALNALIAGQIHLMFGASAAVKPHAASGKLRALAITSAKPSKVSDLPTVAAAALPNYQSVVSYGVFGPPKMLPAVISRLNQEISRSIHDPGLAEKIYNVGAEPIGNSSGEFSKMIKTEMEIMGNVLRKAGLTPN